MKSGFGTFELETPRDRSGTFEPQLVRKHQTHVSDKIEAIFHASGKRLRDIPLTAAKVLAN